MTRRSLIAGLIGGAMMPKQLPAEKDQQWVITGGHRLKQDGCDVDPIYTTGADTLEALANSGISVWRLEKYNAFLASEVGKEFEEGCAAQRLKRAKELVNGKR